MEAKITGRKIGRSFLSRKRRVPDFSKQKRRASGNTVETAARHPIVRATEALVHSIMDVRLCVADYIPAARSAYRSELTSCVDTIKTLVDQLEGGAEHDAHKANELAKVARRLNRVSLSRTPKILQESLFVALFSAFDRFVGDVVRALFEVKGDLFRSINSEVKFVDMLAATSLEDVKRGVLSNEIESLRRQSYIEQFKWFESFFDIKLREWGDWAGFVEATQRRNLYVHNDGVVSAQYLTVCDSVGFKFKSRPAIGERLALEDRYFSRVTEFVMDAGVMLAHTLWRKVVPDQLEQADNALNMLIYDFLNAESWSDARRIGKFHVDQRRVSSDLHLRMAVVNLAIAHKFYGSSEYTKLLAGYDWSSSLPEFQLAICVLGERFADAAKVFKAIGRSGTLLKESSCHEWPLFRDFRRSDAFLTSYAEIYGKPFVEVVEKEAKEMQSEIEI